MIDVILINPAEFIPDEVYSPGYHWKHNGKIRLREAPHLGLLYIAAVLEDGGFTVKVLDSDECTIPDYISSILKQDKPRIIGISSTTPTFMQAIQTAKICKASDPSAIIVLGGIHPTCFHKQIIEKYDCVDVVVRGEGEYPMLDLARGHAFSSIHGITYRKNGFPEVNEPRDPISDLDTLPMPARHLIKSQFDGGIEGMFRLTKPGEFYTILTSRGCPFECTFCIAAGPTSPGFRQRSADSVVGEIYQLAKEGIKFIQIQDMNFILSRDRVKKICSAFLETGINWACLGRVDRVSEELYTEMYRSGCRFVSFGIESGSQKVLDYYHKRITVDDIRRGVKTAKKVGLDVIATLIVGSPVETFEDVQETLKLVIDLDIDFISVCRLNIFPHTPVWISAREKGLISNNWEDDLTSSEVFDAPTKEQAIQWQEYITKGFYARKSYMIKQILRTLIKRRGIAKMNILNVWNILSSLNSSTGKAN
jgi:radical SAM superfamily enzyme YgiQ (UPF0313 family)